MDPQLDIAKDLCRASIIHLNKMNKSAELNWIGRDPIRNWQGISFSEKITKIPLV